MALAEACASGPRPLGAEIELGAGGGRADLTLFGEGPSRVVVSVEAERARHFEAADERVPRCRGAASGRVGGDRLRIRAGEASLVDLGLNRIDERVEGRL